MQAIKRSLTGNFDYYSQSDIKLELVRVDYNPNQPRDSHGRFASSGGGGGGGGGSLSKKKLPELESLAREIGAAIPTRYKNRKSSWIAVIEKAKGKDKINNPAVPVPPKKKRSTGINPKELFDETKPGGKNAIKASEITAELTEKYNGYIPITEYRDRLKGLSREEQDQALYALEQKGLITLGSLVEASRYSGKEVSQGIPTRSGSPLFFIKPEKPIASAVDVASKTLDLAAPKATLAAQFTTEGLRKKRLTDLEAIARDLGVDPPTKYKNRKSSWIDAIEKARSKAPNKPLFKAKSDIDKKHIEEWNNAYKDSTRARDVSEFRYKLENVQEEHSGLLNELSLLKQVPEANLKAAGLNRGDLVKQKQLQVDQAAKKVQAAEKALEKEKAAIANSPYKGMTEDQLDRIGSSEWVFGSATEGANKTSVIDANGRLQAAFSWNEAPSSIYIQYLASAPWNLGGSDPRKTKGAGTQAIVEAIKLSKEKGHGGKVTLTALDDAVPFYEKLGFTKSFAGMTLEPAKANELLTKVGQQI